MRYGRLRHACAAPTRTSAACFAVLKTPVAAAAAATAGAQAYRPGAGASLYGPAGGLTPQDFETAYGYSSAAGTGQTVAIVDAYDDPDVESDLAAFDQHYGLGECDRGNGCFEKVDQQGDESPPAADHEGWSLEIALDVETVRSVCRGCKILLVEAASDAYSNLAAAVREAGRLGAQEISNSYGGPESGLGGEAIGAYDQPGVVIAAATGDDGWDDWNYEEQQPNAPATLPDVVAVGGTTLSLEPDGARASETVWNDYGVEGELGLRHPGYATGGGCSVRFGAQPWQLRAPDFTASACGSKRLAADVAADADPFTGLDVYDSYDYCTKSACRKEFESEGDWHTVGGTSLATPLISAMYALAGGGAGAPYPAVDLYGHLGGSSLYDVTEGGSGYCDAEPISSCAEPALDCDGTTACDGAEGFDGPTGVGTPNGLGALQPLLPSAAIQAPQSLSERTTGEFSGQSSSDPYPDGTIASWRWSWGDGTESSGADASHAYALAGRYTVTLTVTDEYGLSADVSTQVEVAALPTGEREAAEKAEREVAEQREREAAEKAERAAAEKTEREAGERLALEAAARLELEHPAISTTATGSTTTSGSSDASIEVKGFKAAAVPDVTLLGSSARVDAAGVFWLTIACPEGETRCIGSIALTLARGHGRGALAGSRVSLGRFALAGGKRAREKLTLSARARALLEQLRVLGVHVSIAARDTAGAAHEAVETIVLRPSSHEG